MLGGFTTFSTYVAEVRELLRAGATGTAVGYLTGTLLAAVAATWLGLTAARSALAWVQRRRAVLDVRVRDRTAPGGGAYGAAVANVAGSIAAGLAAVFCGAALVNL